MFVPGKPFKPSLMFVGQAGAYPSEAPFSFFTRVGSGLTHKHLTRLEKLAEDKHSRLLHKFVNYGQKSFITLGPRLKNLRGETLQLIFASSLVTKTK